MNTEKGTLSSKQKLHPNRNFKVAFDCYWMTGCSDSARCNAKGSCVAASQAGGATFPQQMEPDNRPLSHMEILSAVAHHASEIARLTAAIPVQCKPVETSSLPHASAALKDFMSELGEIMSMEDGATPADYLQRARDIRQWCHDHQTPGSPVEPKALTPAQLGQAIADACEPAPLPHPLGCECRLCLPEKAKACRCNRESALDCSVATGTPSLVCPCRCHPENGNKQT